MSTPTAKPPRREGPNLDSLYMINTDGSQKKIHPADVRGRFQRLKKLMWAVMIGIYLVVPWLKIGGNPVVLADLSRRQFFLLGKAFTTQDFYLAFFFVTGLAFSLYVISSLWGRLWCGYACPHTVFLEGVFRRIERFFEGSAAQRERLAKAPWSAGKWARKLGKWGTYLVIALVLSHTFLSYFMPVEEVYLAVSSPPAEHPTAFAFVMVFTAIIYFNFAWFREQLCIVICPYGRLQSVLYDTHTVNVGYDESRGEPRGHHKTEGRGDCIDCFRCVSVCPTGIDIRNGTQLECVGCANCIDACDEVMDKLGQERGLVRYDSQAGFAGEPRKLIRSRTILYGILLLIGMAVFSGFALSRQSFEAQLHRASAAPFVVTESEVINSFRVHLVNKFEDTRSFRLRAEAPAGVEVRIAQPELALKRLESKDLTVITRVPKARYQPGMRLAIIIEVGEEARRRELPILGPR